MRKSGRKLMAAGLAAAMVLSMAACGGKAADATTAAQTEAETTTEAPKETTAPETTAAEAEAPKGDTPTIAFVPKRILW